MGKKNWLILALVFVIGLGSAFPVYLSPLDGGSLQPNTEFDYVFNFTTGSDCDGVVLSNSTSITTDDYGFGFVDLDISSLSEMPSYLCEYRNGTLRAVHNFSDMVLGRVWANNVNVSGSVYAGSFVGDGSGLSGIDSSSFWGGNSTSINYSGNVGIGTVSPEDLLHIYGGDGGVTNNGKTWAFARLIIEDDNNVGIQLSSRNSDSNAIAFGDDSNAVSGRILYNHNGDYLTFDTTASEAMRIDSSGNVGIGTVSPDAKLEVAGSVNLNDSLYVNGSTGNVGIGTASPEDTLTVYQTADSSGLMVNGYDDQSGEYINMYVNANGRGTFYSSDAMLFDIGGGNDIQFGQNILSGTDFYFGSTYKNVNPDFRFHGYAGGAVEYANFQIDGSTTNFELSRKDSGLGYFDIQMPTIFTGGNVGIGTASPGEKLEVNGSVSVTDGNITIESQNKMCFNAACDSYVWYNGTNLQIVG